MKNFVSQIDAVKAALSDRKQSIIALDIEENQGIVDYNLVRGVVEESVRYLKNINITPYIYTRTSFWDKYVAETPDIVKECPLWIARWGEAPPQPYELPKGWHDWAIWQYADKGSVPGITGPVDLNRIKIA